MARVKTKGRASLAEQFDARAQLLMLDANLKEELRDQDANLTVTLHRARLTVAYHEIVVLHWKGVGSDLVCTPVGWRRKTYMAHGPVQAREITIRLVFEFVRQFRRELP
jgi:hypothetical protein